jgi:hypothetical protein
MRQNGYYGQNSPHLPCNSQVEVGNCKEDAYLADKHMINAIQKASLQIDFQKADLQESVIII